MEFRRKLYKRGGSYETTVPKPILFSIDPEEKHEVVFLYDKELRRWYIELASLEEPEHNQEQDDPSDTFIIGERFKGGEPDNK